MDENDHYDEEGRGRRKGEEKGMMTKVPAPEISVRSSGHGQTERGRREIEDRICPQ